MNIKMILLMIFYIFHNLITNIKIVLTIINKSFLNNYILNKKVNIKMNKFKTYLYN